MGRKWANIVRPRKLPKMVLTQKYILVVLVYVAAKR